MDGLPGAASGRPAAGGETSERSRPGWKSPRPLPPSFHIKSRASWRKAAVAREAAVAELLRGPGLRSPLRRDGCSPSLARPRPAPAARLRGLPAGIMRGPELPLLLLALVLCQAPRGPAAPVSAGGGTVLAKMYPRGNHWAVGHLMGKKSTDESQYVSEEDKLKEEQLREYIRWEEATRNLLGLLEAMGSESHQAPQHQALGLRQPTWDTEDSSYFKDRVDALLRNLKRKKGTPS